MNKELEKNVEVELNMLREVSIYNRKLFAANEIEKKLLNDAIESLKNSIKIINSATPKLVREIGKSQKLPAKKVTKKFPLNLERIKFTGSEKEVDVVLSKEDKERFLEELRINENLVKRIKNVKNGKKENIEGFKPSRGYISFANKLFFNTAKNLIERRKFSELYKSLKKANIEILFESYIAMMLLTTLIGFVVSVFATVFLFFFDISFAAPFISASNTPFFTRTLKIIWIPFVFTMITFFAVYIYPFTERRSIREKINQELPFAVIHMSAISGSGIEPSEIFKIIGLGEEYPTLRKEITKILNQINLYGYDLVTALNNASKSAPSESLAELFIGLATTITSGANLQEFFEKRAETLLLGYRLAREKYTKLIETFLDIYISVVIAAPMVFLLLLVLMSISGIQVGFTSAQLSLLSVFGIALLNFVFIILLQMKQPPY